mgnify:CR=1 FL=1
MDFDGGSYTIADWAYPDEKVLVFIDGMSEKIHGNPEQQKKDKLLRAKAKMKGYRVVELSAQDLHDDAVIAIALGELGVYLTIAEG